MLHHVLGLAFVCVWPFQVGTPLAAAMYVHKAAAFLHPSPMLYYMQKRKPHPHPSPSVHNPPRQRRKAGPTTAPPSPADPPPSSTPQTPPNSCLLRLAVPVGRRSSGGGGGRGRHPLAAGPEAEGPLVGVLAGVSHGEDLRCWFVCGGCLERGLWMLMCVGRLGFEGEVGVWWCCD